jgi:hypothetical protein
MFQGLSYGWSHLSGIEHVIWGQISCLSLAPDYKRIQTRQTSNEKREDVIETSKCTLSRFLGCLAGLLIACRSATTMVFVIAFLKGRW